MCAGWVLSLGREDPLEKEMATPVFLPGQWSHDGQQLMGLQRLGHDLVTESKHTP